MAKQAPDTVEARPVEVNALGITYQIALEEGRTIAYESKVDATCSTEDMDELLDRLHDATERQLARVNLPKAKGKLKIARIQLRMQEQLHARTESEQLAHHRLSRKQGEFRPSEAQRNNLTGIETSIARFRADLPIIEWEIARLEAIIARREPPEEPARLAEAAD